MRALTQPGVMLVCVLFRQTLLFLNVRTEHDGQSGNILGDGRTATSGAVTAIGRRDGLFALVHHDAARPLTRQADGILECFGCFLAGKAAGTACGLSC
jgi:hypothetical protein